MYKEYRMCVRRLLMLYHWPHWLSISDNIPPFSMSLCIAFRVIMKNQCCECGLNLVYSEFSFHLSSIESERFHQPAGIFVNKTFDSLRFLPQHSHGPSCSHSNFMDCSSHVFRPHLLGCHSNMHLRRSERISKEIEWRWMYI